MLDQSTNIYNQVLFGISPEAMRPMQKLLYKFILNEIPYHEAAMKSRELIGTSEHIENLMQLMQVPDKPPVAAQITPDMYLDKKSKTWSQYEDQRLLAGIHRGGILDWNKISEFVGNGRNRGQCAQRWFRSLNPTINKTAWTKEEDDLLLSLVKKHGHRGWTKIANEIDGRTDVQCRYRFQIISKRPLPKRPKLPVENNTLSILQTTNTEKEETPADKKVPDMNNLDCEEQINQIAEFCNSMQLLDLLNEVKSDPFSLFKQYND